jgi:hypothetical protein
MSNEDAVPKDDQQQTFGPNSEPHGWAVMEVLTRDMYGALRSRTTIRAKDGFLDMAIEEYVGTQGRAKRTDVRLHGEALEVLRSILTRPVAAPVAPTAEQAEGVLVDADRYQWLRRRAVMVDYSDETVTKLTLFKNEGPTGEFLDDWIDGECAASSTGEQA